MGAGTSPADPAAAADRTIPVPPGGGARGADERAEGVLGKGVSAAVEGAGAEGPDAGPAGEEATDAEAADGETAAEATAEAAGVGSGSSAPASGEPASGEPAPGDAAPSGGPPVGPRPSRRFPSFTRDTARPEGGGRAASGDAPAPARQWPLLAVLCTAGIGLLIVAVNPFAEAFRIGTILIGVALIGGAVLRCVVPSVGMLAVRSRFTDLVTYGLLGVLIVLLALVAQPKPWLDVPFLEHAVRFTIR
ncbi:DUF3017 domain-containing protein [Streptomyces sp. NBC_01799]|uniref:DUF3017 domain-containing protein n=1 Tax=Streptomyces sp. NBC_01800 TaxID=2975945 RepID=UPI002DDAE0E9|nr:DUF3017 domain-containing protein [Streptomyces sp. NBC_01800]WSA70115.1 DUF3017 domain-containing protein [Streptomyces sp. NBC_01800]WSA78593.1 DUF3017 domain-containing protein [Streptomyces sp. NBC_01799]